MYRILMICIPGIQKPEPIFHISRQKEMESRLEEGMAGTIMLRKLKHIYPGKNSRMIAAVNFIRENENLLIMSVRKEEKKWKKISAFV